MWTNIHANWMPCKNPRVKHLTEIALSGLVYQILVSSTGKVYRRHWGTTRMEILVNPGRK